MKKIDCFKCKTVFLRHSCQVKEKNFCSKSCTTSYRNTINNPSWYRDVAGEKNPMYGKPNLVLREWNKNHTGKNSPNYKDGGIHKRKDGYYRINIGGKRYLYHRYLLGLLDNDKVVHHIDHNPSNNNLDNLMIFENQAEHVKYEQNVDSFSRNNS